MQFELRFKDDEVKKALVAAAKRHIRNTVIQNAGTLEEKIRDRYAVAVRTSPEYKSLVAPQGMLRKDFGIEDSVETMKSVIDVLLDNVRVNINRAANDNLTYIIPLSITIFDKKSLNALLRSGVGSYFSDQQPHWSGAEVPWLRWLLLSGDTPVVIGYTVFYGDFDKYGSRTGKAIMVNMENWDKPREDFTVDERFQGTERNNFLTRAGREVIPQIEGLIKSTMFKGF